MIDLSSWIIRPKALISPTLLHVARLISFSVTQSHRCSVNVYIIKRCGTGNSSNAHSTAVLTL
jgi:hypothetical protein